MPSIVKERTEATRQPPAEPAVVAPPIDWLRPAAQIATLGIFIIMLGITLSLARGVLRPVAAAIIVVMMLGPLARLTGRRLPPLLFAILVVGFIIALIHVATILLSGPVA